MSKRALAIIKAKLRVLRRTGGPLRKPGTNCRRWPSYRYSRYDQPERQGCFRRTIHCLWVRPTGSPAVMRRSFPRALRPVVGIGTIFTISKFIARFQRKTVAQIGNDEHNMSKDYPTSWR